MRSRPPLVALLAASALVMAGLTAAVPASQALAQAPSCPWVGSTAPIPQRVSQVMAQMTLDQKISMVHGTSGPYVGNIAAIPSLCIPALKLEDGPAGVADGMNGVTQLPAPVSAAASWDPSVTQQYGSVVGAEEWGKGANVNLGPTVNIVRDPRWGRAFESYSEDPYLAGQLGVGYIQGVQSQGVLAQVKHWAVYNQETNRNTPSDNAIISARTMHEIYMPQFQAAVQQGGASSVMCSYSTINGTYACENPYINNVLKQQWGFPGFITSDWGATHSTVASANAGLDMQMPDDSYFGAPLKQAIQNGQVPTSRLDDMVSRILTEMFRFRLFERTQTGTPSSVVTSPAHIATARSIAEQGTVLLQNNGGALPLDTSKVHSIAVIGADAGQNAQTAGGGSASVNPSNVITPLQGITSRAGSGINVSYARGPAPDGSLPTVPASAFDSPLSAQFYNNMTLSGSPVATRTDPNVDFNWNGQSPQSGVNPTQWSATWSGTITPQTTGTYTFSLTSDDGSRLFVNGQQIIDNWRDQAANTETGTVSLTAGQQATIKVEYYQDGGGSSLNLGWEPPGQDPISQAVATAKAADVAVVFASNFESEGSDLNSIDLPGQQNQLISAVAQANPNTIVVLNTGSAVTMPWLSQVKGVLEGWYPGEQDGNAIASVLFGDVNPSGHLPITFPQSLSQVPASTTAQWPGTNGQVQYSEGLDVGYRWYADKGITPLFPFGYGLSYTSFAFHNLSVSPSSTTSRGTVTASADVTNTGSRAGADVAQLYVGDPRAAGEPPQQLKGFQKVTLAPGETKRLSFRLDPSAFAHWDDTTSAWAVSDGSYKIMVGDSAGNLPLTSSVNVTTSYGPQGVSVQAPDIVQPGSTSSVTATLTNEADVPLLNAALKLDVPSGWSVQPASASLGTVGAHSTGTATFKVSAPASAGSGSYQLTSDASYAVEDVGPGQVSGSASLTVPYTSLSGAYDDAGVSNDSDPAAGNFDGGGYSYSAQALAAAGITPGGTVSGGGFSFTWPSPAPGDPNNVTTTGQVVDLTASGSQLAFLGAGTFGTQTGNVTVTYTDGSTSTGTITMPDWYSNAAAPGSALVATTSHWNIPAGSTLDPNHNVSLYESSVPLDAGKTVAYVTLPNDPNMHVFATASG
ncbi:MAG TPA: glycoside hydrolase family 3 C-terminal domain-containing protein [Streptosporangiaceae bacterium]|nr:glycoside hydrolase family 3 C-terminal domain-containing protein [Streptosporangiaceae bacterium]